jgi:hypothetical protein
MIALHNHRPRRRARLFRLWLTGVLVLAAAAGACWSWFAMMARWEERRPFVGTWRLMSMSPAHSGGTNVICETDLMSDGTVHVRAWDSRTGAFLYDEPFDARWRVSQGTLQHVIGGYPVLRSLGIGVGERVRVNSSVTWQGPDQFRLETDHPSYTQASVWSRCERPGDR